MTKVNLRDYYPFYNKDIFIDVSDEIANALLEAERQERTYRRRMYRYKAQYSLDKEDGIEHNVLFVSLSPCEIYERKVTYEQLHAAIASLPDKQAKRIYAHYILGISQTDIARAEGVDSRNVRKSISKGLRNMEIFLKKYR
ncbi:MAG: sigma-70 region 4 domain-containing protein [Oscillospiraceae bacterium]|nr:sigma-70 region 4 domain-containing protein [Oscillospiraceae bacterium]MEA5040379.1 sigma-70 region 4 domain-containing protein [Clostridiaceae bacterium]